MSGSVVERLRERAEGGLPLAVDVEDFRLLLAAVEAARKALEAELHYRHGYVDCFSALETTKMYVDRAREALATLEKEA